MIHSVINKMAIYSPPIFAVVTHRELLTMLLMM